MLCISHYLSLHSSLCVCVYISHTPPVCACVCMYVCTRACVNMSWYMGRTGDNCGTCFSQACAFWGWSQLSSLYSWSLLAAPTCSFLISLLHLPRCTLIPMRSESTPARLLQCVMTSCDSGSYKQAMSRLRLPLF